jgi:hypothetical protein
MFIYINDSNDFIHSSIRAHDAINGAGSYSYEQEELIVLCEKALYKRSAGITVCVSDGNNLCRIKGISGQQVALSRLRIAREQPGDQTMTERAPAGATPAGHTWS